MGLLGLGREVLRDVPQFAIDWAKEESCGDSRWGFGFDRLDFDHSKRIWLIGCRGSCVMPLFPIEPHWKSAEDLKTAFDDFLHSERWAIFAWTVNHNKMHDDIDFDR